MPAEVKYFKGTIRELQSHIKSHSPPQDNPATDALRLCKLFGAYRCLSEVKGMVPIIHGPIGCACNNRYFVGLATKAHGFPVDLCLTSTNMSEKDVIFGGEDKLREAILEVKKRYNPKIITVFSTCPAGIIGDDIDGVIDSVRHEVDAKILPIHSEGYSHFNLYAGYRDAYDALINNLVKPRTKIMKNTINIIGDKNDYKASDSMNDIRSLMKTLEKLDIKLHSVIPGGATLEEIENSANVSLNVMKCDSMAIDFCSIMKENFGVEHTNATMPLGVEATTRWIMEIAEKLDMKEKAVKVIQQELADVEPYVSKARSVLEGKRVAVTGNYARAIAFLEFALELGMKPSYLGLYGFAFAGEEMLDRLCERVEDDFEIVVGISMHEHKEMIGRLKPDLFLGDFREKACPMNYGIPCGDVPLGQQPQLGFEGVKTLSDWMVNWYNNPLTKKYGSKYSNDREMCDQNFVDRCLNEKSKSGYFRKSDCV